MTKVWNGNKAHETIENLRRLNTELMGKLNESKKANASMKEDYAQLEETSAKQRDESMAETRLLKESLNSKDQMIHSLSMHKENLTRELRRWKRMHQEFRDSSLSMERRMMYRLCDMEEKCGRILLECTTRMKEFQKKNESLEKDVKTYQEQKEKCQSACTRLSQENIALKGAVTKHGRRDESADKDLAEARRAIEFLFPRWKENKEENGKLREKVCSLEFQLKQLREEREIVKSDFDKQKEISSLGIAQGIKDKEKLQESVSSLEEELAGLRNEHEITKSKFNKLRDSGAWTGVLLQRQEDRIVHLTNCLREERSRVKDMGVNTGRFMDHLDLERRGRSSLSRELDIAHQEKKDLTNDLVSLRREQMGWTNFVKWFHQGHTDALSEVGVGSFLEDIERIKTHIMEMEKDMEELHHNGTHAHEICKKNLYEAIAEMEVLKERNGKLNKENESLKDSYSALQQNMAKRMVSLKNHFQFLKSGERKTSPSLS